MARPLVRAQGVPRHHRAMPRLGRIASVEFVDRASMRPDGDVQRRENERCAQPSLDTDGRSTAFFIPSITCWAAP